MSWVTIVWSMNAGERSPRRLGFEALAETIFVAGKWNKENSSGVNRDQLVSQSSLTEQSGIIPKFNILRSNRRGSLRPLLSANVPLQNISSVQKHFENSAPANGGQDKSRRIALVLKPLKEQRALIQKLNDKMELNTPAPQTVLIDQ